MKEENIFFQIDRYLIKNCKDKDFFAKRYLPEVAARKYIILNHFGTWESYENFLSQLNGYSEEKKQKVVDKFINAKPEDIKYSVRGEIFDKLNGKIDTTEKYFSDYLFKLIKQKNLTEVEVYKKAKLDRRIFSKIRKEKNYMPSKQTVLALIIALELNSEEAEILLNRAGYHLTAGRKEDVIVEYFIENQIYDLFLINEVLEHYDCPTLGS